MFKEGEKIPEAKCPKCGKQLEYGMSFRDAFNHKTGHYTVDVPVIACTECDYAIEIDTEEVEE